MMYAIYNTGHELFINGDDNMSEFSTRSTYSFHVLEIDNIIYEDRVTLTAYSGLVDFMNYHGINHFIAVKLVDLKTLDWDDVIRMDGY